MWDILRLLSSCRAALSLYVILTLWRGRGTNQPPYALLHRSSSRYALHHGRRHDCVITMQWRPNEIDTKSNKTLFIALVRYKGDFWKLNFLWDKYSFMNKLIEMLMEMEAMVLFETHYFLLAKKAINEIFGFDATNQLIK